MTNPDSKIEPTPEDFEKTKEILEKCISASGPYHAIALRQYFAEALAEQRAELTVNAVMPSEDMREPYISPKDHKKALEDLRERCAKRYEELLKPGAVIWTDDPRRNVIDILVGEIRNLPLTEEK